jgi:transglutaminase superfamily protein
MWPLCLEAYRQLMHFDFFIVRRDFPGLYQKVRDCPLQKHAPDPDMIERVCSAVDTACIWYWREVLCLQRSAAAACLLKRRGVPAQMVIGAQQLPFKAHAWVEVRGQVVNDKPYAREMYAVLDRC